MSPRLWLLRTLAMTALAVWFGGFTFYGAAVVPVLHEALDGFEAGQITQRVTDRLNAIGVVAVVLLGLLARAERGSAPIWARRTRVALLGLTTALLVGLIGLHRLMDARLATDGLAAFYPYHRAYLIASTAQWAANLGIVAATSRLGRP